LDFLELILDRKIRGLSPRGCGPRRPGPPWTGGHCRELELIRARPPAPPDAGQGAEEEEESTGVPVPGSPGLGRWQSGGATMVKVAVEERSAWARSGHGERGRRGGGGVVRKGGAEAPFYRVGGGAGWLIIGEERAAAVVVAEWRHHSGCFGLA
jgi:hypothetical protein